MVLVLVAGVFMFGLGIVGVRYAPVILEEQRKRGSVPAQSGVIDDEDRLRATRGVGGAFAVVGLLLVVYALL